MIFNKSTYNFILASIFALLLSACAQQAAKIDSQIQGDVYTGTDTVEYLADGVPDKSVLCNKRVSFNYCFKRHIEKTSSLVKKKF